MKYIDYESVGKIYGEQDLFLEALRDVTFGVDKNEFVAIVGPSGCGKTTLLKITAGIIPETKGQVFVDGKEVEGPLANVGMVFQSPVLLKWRTVLENILLPVEVLSLDRKKYLARAYELCSTVDLKGFEDKYPFELSGGMQQRVSICRALIHDPSILLMDEPFGALDALTRDELNLELLRVWEEKKSTVVFVTHSIQESVFLADRVLIMTPRPGRISKTVKIDLERPRNADMKFTEEFTKCCMEVRNEIDRAKIQDRTRC